MPITVTKKDLDLVEMLRGPMVSSYRAGFLRQGLDYGSANRMANKKFESQLSRGELTIASKEEIDAKAKAEGGLRGFIKKLRVKAGLALMPKANGGAK